VATDAVGVLAELPDVAAAAVAGREAVDALLWDRAARSRGRALAAESTVLGAWASAAFEGAEVPVDTVRAGGVEDSPVGVTVARAVAMYAEVPAVADMVLLAPLQALARLHSVVAVGLTPEDSLGRPRSGDAPDDPLRLRTATTAAAQLPERLMGVAGLLTAPTTAPAMVVAGLVHAELATMLPFAWGSGVVARVMTRVVLRAKGVDPDGWTIPEAGLRMLGRPKYVAALRHYASGDPDAVARWLVVHSEIVAAGARAAHDGATDLPTD
jgi:hypothetical protein